MSEPGRPGGVDRIRAALGRRLRGPYAGIERIERRLDRLGLELDAMRAELQAIHTDLEAGRADRDELRADLSQALRALAADEPRNRRLLSELREGHGYRLPWSEESHSSRSRSRPSAGRS